MLQLQKPMDKGRMRTQGFGKNPPAMKSKCKSTAHENAIARAAGSTGVKCWRFCFVSLIAVTGNPYGRPRGTFPLFNEQHAQAQNALMAHSSWDCDRDCRNRYAHLGCAGALQQHKRAAEVIWLKYRGSDTRGHTPAAFPFWRRSPPSLGRQALQKRRGAHRAHRRGGFDKLRDKLPRQH